ncbi:MAG: 4-hydroxythreonine-4-phosphate dehydrogenase PdxA [Planctomycetes bacterium]|nr:4-hydroxythreonine-4-phosphate dehydrogenase PdxA [Planctomycetota bacterium]
MNEKIVIAVSSGDPAGIGPEITAGAAAALGDAAGLVITGEKRYFDRTAGSFEYVLCNRPEESLEAAAAEGRAALLETSTPDTAPLGEPGPAGGKASIIYLQAALDLVTGRLASALVTAPISKTAIAMAGFHYPGHTELLGEKTNSRPVMMLSGGGMRFSLVTVHVPVSEISRSLNTEDIIRVAETTARDLERRFRIDSPRVAVMGLNPHASDGGRFGREEELIISPAVEKLRSSGMRVTGPLAPDTVPFRLQRGEFDAAIAMYHEQAALPVKTAAFETGVNITLGLPIIRTSPDHGTAFDIAGKHRASHSSMLEALRTAVRLAAG